MKAHELFEVYPIAGKIIIDHYKEVMKGGGNLSPEMEEFLTDEVVKNGTCVMLDKNPRALLDLLDDHGIHATLVITYVNHKPVFTVDINGAVSETIFDNRYDAEVYLLENSVEILNNKIS
jgi:sulfur carrier protein ThiS